MVLIESDYTDFENKKKYLSAKLLTYFVEHPLLFVGYSAEDPNIKSILSDVDEIISSEGRVIPNIYILEWKPEVHDSEYPITEKMISIEKHRAIRVKCITAASFKWVYEAFLYTGEIEKVNVKILRSLLARTYELVRTDIPRKEIEVNYKALENITSKEDGLVTLYGISLLDDPKYLNIAYPYTLSDISRKLGYFTRKNKGDWQKSEKLIEKIVEIKDINIKESDNVYHIYVTTGHSSGSHKYSDSAFSLLEKIRDGLDYNKELENMKI